MTEQHPIGARVLARIHHEDAWRAATLIDPTGFATYRPGGHFACGGAYAVEFDTAAGYSSRRVTVAPYNVRRAAA